jgi:hypothetical protein
MAERFDIGMVISTSTGKKVLAVQKLTNDPIVFRQSLQNNESFIRLDGPIGTTFNYVTLEYYGSDLKILKKFKNNGKGYQWNTTEGGR